MLRTAWLLVGETIASFIADGALTSGAAIAFYTLTAIGPIFLIIIAIVGTVFGHDAAEGAVSAQLSGLLGAEPASLIEAFIKGAAHSSSGLFASIAGTAMLCVTASGVFGEIQTALNVIWKIELTETPVLRAIRSRIVSLCLVITLGIIVTVWLIVSSALVAFNHYLGPSSQTEHVILQSLTLLISFSLIFVLFAAIYKVLPNLHLQWRDVLVGAFATTFLVFLGKFFIGLYLEESALASGYGAVGSLILVTIWIYYSAQIFLLGAEFTKVYAERLGSQRRTGAHLQAPVTTDQS